MFVRGHLCCPGAIYFDGWLLTAGNNTSERRYCSWFVSFNRREMILGWVQSSLLQVA